MPASGRRALVVAALVGLLVTLLLPGAAGAFAANEAPGETPPRRRSRCPSGPNRTAAR